MQYTIDAENKSMGRIASQVAVLLRGKNSPDFAPHIKPSNKVTIINASKTKLTGKKFTDKVYLRHSGYPGGQKSETLEDVVTKKGYEEVFRKAIYGMLPDNRLRKIMMNNLIIKE